MLEEYSFSMGKFSMKKLSICGFIIFLFFIFIIELLEPFSYPLNINVSNITNAQASFSWTTEKPTKGEVFVSKNKNSPLLPYFQKMEKDDGEKKLNKSGYYLTHHVTVKNLTSETKYYFAIFQGWRKVYEGEFKTGKILSSLSLPNPVYGKILNAKKKPLVGAIVLLEVETSSVFSSLLSTLTNNDGRWSLDLGNLRTKDLNLNYKIASRATEKIIIETGQKKFKARTRSGFDKPWPDVILK